MNHHFAILFSGCSHTEAKMFYMTLQDHMIKGFGDFMEGNSSLHIPHPAKFDSHRPCVNGYIVILVCQVILRDHMIIRSC